MRRLCAMLQLALVCAAAGCGESADAGADAAACPTDQLAWGRGGELMLPGTDCMACHREGGRATDSVFTAAGTVFRGPTCPEGLQGAVVTVEDAEGTTVDMTTNAIGNFFTSLPLSPPLQVSVDVAGETVMMSGTPGTGACGSCHELDRGAGLIWGP